MVEWKTLNDLCLKITDGSHFSPQSVEEGFYMPSVKDMTSKGFDYSSCKKISEDDYLSLIKTGCKPKINDVLVAKDGSMLKYVFPVSKEENIVVLSSIAILTPKTDVIDSRYLSFYLLRSDVKEQTIREFSSKGGVPRIILKNFKKIRIPIPSLSEQKRIGGILDTFTSAIDNLKEQIAQRRKQYGYYRDQLLDLEGKPGVEMKTIGDIAKYRRGSFPQPYGNKEWYDGEGAMPFVQVADVEENVMRLKKNTKQFISRLAMPKSVFAPIGTIIVTLQGSIGKVAITQYDSYVDRTLGIFESFKIDINKKFFFFFLEKIFSIKKEKARGGTIKTITKEEFTNFIIPLPPLSEQQRIVSILDTFEASIQNLEAQLKEREKQYEYYRNKLLSFE